MLCSTSLRLASVYDAAHASASCGATSRAADPAQHGVGSAPQLRPRVGDATARAGSASAVDGERVAGYCRRSTAVALRSRWHALGRRDHAGRRSTRSSRRLRAAQREIARLLWLGKLFLRIVWYEAPRPPTSRSTPRHRAPAAAYAGDGGGFAARSSTRRGQRRAATTRPRARKVRGPTAASNCFGRPSRVLGAAVPATRRSARGVAVARRPGLLSASAASSPH